MRRIPIVSRIVGRFQNRHATNEVEKESRLFLRDLIYFDFEKAASIASQLEGGLATEIQESHSRLREAGGEIDARVATLGGTVANTRTTLETKSIHHSLLVKVEDALFRAGVAFDLNGDVSSGEHDFSVLHERMIKQPYVRAQGMSWFQDYERMKDYLLGINRIFEFSRESAKSELRNLPEFQELEREIETKRNAAKSAKATRSRQLLKEADELERELEDTMDAIVKVTVHQSIPEWQINGVVDITEYLMRNRNSLIIQPWDTCRDFEIVANLKQDCFVDSDSDNLLFAYGSRPNVGLTVFGLVTSMPGAKHGGELLTRKRITTSSDQEVQQFEEAYQQIFDGTREIEKFGLSVQYPSVVVYPIAVYRTVRR